MSKTLTKEQVIDMLDDDGYEVMEPGSDEELEFSDIEEAMMIWNRSQIIVML